VRRLDSRSVNACKLTISAPIEAAQHEANSLSPCKSMTHHPPYRSDILSRLAAPSELTLASLALWNQEFSGMQAHGAHIAVAIRCGTAREGLSLIVAMLFNRGPKSIRHPREGESDAA
jgi:hypothetical protein